MTNTLLLSWTKLKQYTDINDSLDAALIKNGIREAQDIQLQRVIGTLLYEKLLNLVETETIDDSENAAYKTLLDSYVQDMLLYASYYNLLEFTFIRTRNNGLLTPQGGENSASVDKSTYEMKRTSTQSKFEYYADRLARYQQNADYASQFRSPIIFSQTTRAKYLDFAHRAGLPIVNSAFPQYPPLNN
mgnify:CR=1 FL=1